MQYQLTNQYLCSDGNLLTDFSDVQTVKLAKAFITNSNSVDFNV